MADENVKEDVPKVNGTWKGTPINIKKVWGGHEFTADECAKLFNDEIIEFEAISSKNNTYIAKGKLEEQEFEGNTFIGFKLITDERFEGNFNGTDISIKRVWGKNDHWEGHRFTDEEIKKLLNGETIEFDAISKANKPYKAKGKLDNTTFNGNTSIRFTLTFDK